MEPLLMVMESDSQEKMILLKEFLAKVSFLKAFAKYSTLVVSIILAKLLKVAIDMDMASFSTIMEMYTMGNSLTINVLVTLDLFLMMEVNTLDNSSMMKLTDMEFTQIKLVTDT